MLDDIIAKAAIILHLIGLQVLTQMGDMTVFADSLLSVESYRDGGLQMRIGYADTGEPALEVWHGVLVCHPGDHALLHAYLLAVFKIIGNSDRFILNGPSLPR